MADLVIRNGTIVDGTGAPPVRGDLAVTGDTITAVGEVDERGAREVDADGLLVTPGFVDIHTHFDGQVTWDPIVAPSSIHGVTTIAMGNCGVGFAPARKDRHDWLIGLLEGVEDIPGTALAEGLTWDWETFPEYLDSLDAKPHTLDLAAHIPHAALRTYVMGDRGADHTEVPTDDELAQLAAQVREGLDAGAIGFATSRTDVHRTKDGTNIGTLTAGERELLAIADAIAKSDHGVTQLISDAYQTPDDAFAAPRAAAHRGVRAHVGQAGVVHRSAGVPLPRPLAEDLRGGGEDARRRPRREAAGRAAPDRRAARARGHREPVPVHRRASPRSASCPSPSASPHSATRSAAAGSSRSTRR